MVPFLYLHALAAPRGDGLHPELRALFERLAASKPHLAVTEVGRPMAEYMADSEPHPASAEDAVLPKRVPRVATHQ